MKTILLLKQMFLKENLNQKIKIMALKRQKIHQKQKVMRIIELNP